MKKNINKIIYPFIIFFISCSIKTISYQDFNSKKNEIINNNINLIIDEEIISKDTINFYLRHLNPEIISKIEVLPKKLHSKYGYHDNTKVLFIKTVAYKGIIEKDINFFRNNYPKAVWVINGKPFIMHGELLIEELLIEELQIELDRIKIKEISKMEFIFPEMARELFGNNASGGIIIINSK